MSQQNLLKRSHKADFSASLNRERSFVKTNSNNSKEKRRSQTFVKPAIELYRPPNSRTDLSPSSGNLNVHAKEFTMAQDQREHRDFPMALQSSKSSGNLNQIMQHQQQQHYQQQQQAQQHYQQQQQQQNALQHSKSSGSILKSPPGTWQFIPVPTGLHMPTHSGLLHSNSTSTLIHHLHQQQQIAAAAAAAAAAAQSHRVSFQPQLYGQPFASPPALYTPEQPTFGGAVRQQHQQQVFNGHLNGGGGGLLLKRSKSFTAAAAPEYQSSSSSSHRQHFKNLSNISEQPFLFNSHHSSSSISSPILPVTSNNTSQRQLEPLIAAYATDADRNSLRLAVDEPQQLASRTLMDLVRVIMERVVREGMTCAEGAARVCVAIVEREAGGRETFAETLVNTCQQWYQERDKLLRSITSSSSDGTRFTAFMWFLTELFTRLKRHHTLALTLLSILAACCQACVSAPIRCLAETECLFFVLTSIGRDLEQELPQQLDLLMGGVRDGFLMSMEQGGAGQAVRKTLLQLIELHASSWQLNGSGVLYYYPRIK